MAFVLACCIFSGCSSRTPAGNTEDSILNEQIVSTNESKPDMEEIETIQTEPVQSEPITENDGKPVVYMTTNISSYGLTEIYEALNWMPTGEVAVKLSTGEPPASHYLSPELIAALVQTVDGTIVECNTAYGGSRAETAMHYQVAEDHGFTAIADFQILDENGSVALPVESGTHLSENYVGAAFWDYDSYLILSHFKGHTMAGFGAQSKISLSGWVPVKERHGFTAAVQAGQMPGVVNRMLFWKVWQKQGNQ